MTPVIDADSHWTFSWEFTLDKGPLRKFASALPGEADLWGFFVAEDLIRGLPRRDRPDAAAMFPSRIRENAELTYVPERFECVRLPSDAADRVRWMDEIGIACSLVNSGGTPALFPLIDDIRTRQGFLQGCNDVLAEELHGHHDRLFGMTYADLTDLDWAIAELTRMRAAGSRALSIRSEPVGGKSLAHPHFDRLWSAVTDLGMIINVHVGLAPADFGDWAQMGLDVSTPKGLGRFLRMAGSQRHRSAELIIASMLYGGVFERHPRLSLLVAELGVYWVPGFLAHLERSGFSNPITGDWGGELSIGDYLRRHVRVSALPGIGDADAMAVLRKYPDMIVFSSDYPHAEGNADPIGLYGAELDGLPGDVRNKFMGDTMAESFARMGDPVITTH